MAPNYRYEEVIQFTPREEAAYAYRQILMKEIKDAIPVLKKNGASAFELKEMRRFYDIVNQTDPMVTFKHHSDKKLDQLLLGQRKDPVTRTSSTTGQLVKGEPPDKSIFAKLRRTINNELHHLRPLGRNADVIPDEYNKNPHKLKAFHEALAEANQGAGSNPLGLTEQAKIDHLGLKAAPGSVAESTHAGKPDGAKHTFEQMDPRARAGEYVLVNEPEVDRALGLTNDPAGMTDQIRASVQRDWEAQGNTGNLFEPGTETTPYQRKWLSAGKNFSQETRDMIDVGRKGTLGVPYQQFKGLLDKYGFTKAFQMMSQGKIPLGGIVKGAGAGAILGAKPGRADIGTLAKVTSGDFGGVRDDVLSGSIWGGALGGLTQLAGRVGLQRAAMAVLGKTPPALLGQGIAGVTFQNPEVVEKYAAADNPIDRLKAIPQAFLPDLTEEERKKMEEENEKRLSTPSASTMMSGTATPQSTRPTTWQESMFDGAASTSL